MCDLLRSLKGKLEVFGCRRLPTFNRFYRGHAVERVVDLNAIEPRGIVLKKLFVREPFGIENRPPFFITKTRRTEPNRRHSGIMAQVGTKTPVNIDSGRRDPHISS